MKQTSRITAARYLEEPASWQHSWDLKKKKKKRRQLFVDFDPPNCVAWHLCVCVLIQRDQKRLSSWHNHCFLSHKEQNLQLRGEKGKKKIYFCTKVILSLACVLFCFVGCRIWKRLLDKARGNPDLRWEKSSFWHLGNRRLFFAISARRCRTGMSFLLLLPIFFFFFF